MIGVPKDFNLQPVDSDRKVDFLSKQKKTQNGTQAGKAVNLAPAALNFISNCNILGC